MISLVMTVIGPDRPGVVEAVAKTVSQFGANWLESRMAHLAGQFAGIVHVEVPADQSPRLVQALQELSLQSLTVIVHTESQGFGPPIYAPLLLRVLGADRPGIVHEVTRVLADLQVNVEDLQTVAREELFRDLSPKEIEMVEDKIGDYFDWHGAIAAAIEDCVESSLSEKATT